MPADPPDRNTKILASGLARTIARHTIALGLLILLLAVALVTATTMLERMAERQYVDASSLEKSHEFAISILAHRRNTLLYIAHGDSAYLQDNAALIMVSDSIAAQLAGLSTSPEEDQLVARIGELYAKFRIAAIRDPGLSSSGQQQIINELLGMLERLRAIDTAQLLESRSTSSALNRNIDNATALFLPLCIGLLLVYAYRFWQRIFQPLVRIDDATRRFGAGEVSARAPAGGRDELADLANSFNTMADAIVAREEERRHLLAAVAHDLRSPLTIISGMSDLLPQASPERQRDYLARIALQCRRLDGMTRDLMDSIHVETGDLAIMVKPVDLSAVVRECVADRQALDPDREIALSLPGACCVRGDELRLQRVVSNLLSNASKYSPAQTAIAVALTCVAERALLSVSDKGPGMSAAEQAGLFQPFSRLARTAQHAPGTGLGLYSVRKIIEAHGGVLRLDSHPGSGTTFIVELPRAGDLQAPN